MILRLTWDCKGPRIVKKILILKFGELSVPDSKPYYKTIVIKKVWHPHQDR